MRTVQLRPGPGMDPVEVSFQKGPDGEEIAVKIAARQRPVSFKLIDHRSGLMRLDGRLFPFRVLRQGSSIQIWMRGRTWMLELVERTARRAADADAAAAKAALTAPMPGTILSIRVQAGEAFAAHEPLIVMESMKMEMTLSAPHSGRVTELLCGEGDLVEMNATLARLEAEP